MSERDRIFTHIAPAFLSLYDGYDIGPLTPLRADRIRLIGWDELAWRSSRAEDRSSAWTLTGRALWRVDAWNIADDAASRAMANACGIIAAKAMWPSEGWERRLGPLVERLTEVYQ